MGPGNTQSSRSCRVVAARKGRPSLKETLWGAGLVRAGPARGQAGQAKKDMSGNVLEAQGCLAGHVSTERKCQQAGGKGTQQAGGEAGRRPIEQASVRAWRARSCVARSRTGFSASNAAATSGLHRAAHACRTCSYSGLPCSGKQGRQGGRHKGQLQPPAQSQASASRQTRTNTPPMHTHLPCTLDRTRPSGLAPQAAPATARQNPMTHVLSRTPQHTTPAPRKPTHPHI